MMQGESIQHIYLLMSLYIRISKANGTPKVNLLAINLG
jgi:hypothetical protein